MTFYIHQELLLVKKSKRKEKFARLLKETALTVDNLNKHRVIKEFIDLTDVAIVNRIDEKVKEIDGEIYTRDTFSRG